jgi:16S rRNA (cytidine1402-2'-O)-methyltransferase
VVVAREVTKLHEEFVRGRAVEVFEKLKHKEVRGEITLLIGKAETDASVSPAQNKVNVATRLKEIMDTQKLDEKAALKLLAKEQGVSKSEVYRELQRKKQPGRSPGA